MDMYMLAMENYISLLKPFFFLNKNKKYRVLLQGKATACSVYHPVHKNRVYINSKTQTKPHGISHETNLLIISLLKLKEWVYI